MFKPFMIGALLSEKTYSVSLFNNIDQFLRHLIIIPLNQPLESIPFVLVLYIQVNAVSDSECVSICALAFNA